jgi:hypothetical protein
MKGKIKEKIINTLRIIVLAIILSATIGYSLADWAPPTSAPPFNNTPPPINVGSASQTRTGNLFLENWLFAKKAQTQSTEVNDVGTVLATKDYVDGLNKTARRFVFTSNTTWLVPPGVTKGFVTMAGGGGSGVGWRFSSHVRTGHSGGYIFSAPVNFVPGEVLTVQVGAGGISYQPVNTGVPSNFGVPPFDVYDRPAGDDGLGGYPGGRSRLTSTSTGVLLECDGGSGASTVLNGVDDFNGPQLVAGNLLGANSESGRPNFPSPNRVALGPFTSINGPGACGVNSYGLGNNGMSMWASPLNRGTYLGGRTPLGYGSGGDVLVTGCYVTTNVMGTCVHPQVGRDGVVIIDVVY